MGATTFASADITTKIVWEEELYRDMVYDNFFSKFMGKGSENIMQENTKLEGGQGDQVRFTLIMDLTGDGITGSSGKSLEGNEEAMTSYSQQVYLEEYAHATRDKGPLDRKRPLFNVDETARGLIKTWGQNKLVKLCFESLFASRTNIKYGGSATSLATLTTADKLTPALISKIKTGATTGWNRTYIPLRPVLVDGKSYFVLIVHPDVMYDLKRNSEFQQAMREAEVRGKENPIFRGSTAVWDGVVIHEHELCTIGTDAGTGSDVPYGLGALMGAQAMLNALGARPELLAEEGDYKRWHGFGISMMNKITKSTFNSLDYGVVGVDVARTQISDA